MTSDQKPAAGPSADAKERFRAALDRKKNAEHHHEQARQSTGGVHGAEVAGSTRRTFRRKTG